MIQSLKNCFSKLCKNKIKNASDANVFKYSLDDYEKTYELPKYILRLVGLRHTLNDSPIVRFCWNLYYWFEILNIFVAIILETVKIIETAQGGSFEDIMETFRMLPCMGYVVLAISKSTNLFLHRPVYENLVNELRGMWPKGIVDEEEHTIIDAALKNLYSMTKKYYWCNNALAVIFLSPPIITLIKHWFGMDVTLRFPFFYWWPFNPYQPFLFEFLLNLQNWHVIITLWFMLSGDMWFCVLVTHITTQLDLLSVRIKKLIYVPIDYQLIKEYPLSVYTKDFIRNERRTTETFSDEDWGRRHYKEMREIFLRHCDLIRLAGDVEHLFSFSLLVNFLNSSVIICLIGFCCAVVEKWNEMIYKSFLVTALAQTWLFCWYGQRLLESSIGVADALYNSGWYRASKNVKASILIMMQRSKKGVHVTTYGFSVISLASYSAIIKSAWSYLTLLLKIYSR